MNIPSNITDRQREVITHIKAFHTRNGYSPSVRDLCDLMGGISTNAIHGHLEACAKKGLVTRHPKVARSLALTELGNATVWASLRA